jgi:UDP-N-acetylglucosamine transferase subunit ALG13
MIFVTVGTEKFPFDRLMAWFNVIQDAELLSEEIIVQYGSCTVLPAGARVYRIVRETQLFSLMSQARIVVAHCGEGTLLQLDSLQTPFILVPRSVHYQEHVDDHQVELARALVEVGVPIAWGPSDVIRFLADPFKPSIGDLSVAAAHAVCLRLQERFPVDEEPSGLVSI